MQLINGATSAPWWRCIWSAKYNVWIYKRYLCVLPSRQLVKLVRCILVLPSKSFWLTNQLFVKCLHWFPRRSDNRWWCWGNFLITWLSNNMLTVTTFEIYQPYQTHMQFRCWINNRKMISHLFVSDSSFFHHQANLHTNKRGKTPWFPACLSVYNGSKSVNTRQSSDAARFTDVLRKV